MGDPTRSVSERILPPSTPSGRGWGDGSLVQAYNKRRTVNPENTCTAFRPRAGDAEAAFYVLRNWCKDPRINKPFSALLNSLLQGLKTSCENTTEIDAEGNISIELNLGRVQIK